MKILYVIGQSQYDSVAVFMEQMAVRMQEQGWDVMVLDGRKKESFSVQRQQVLQECFDVIFTINGMLLEEDSTLGKKLLKGENVLYCTYLMDHPFVHYERLKNTYPRIFVLSPDRNHVAYMDQHMKNIYAEAFLPHGGCACANHIRYQERKYDITFMGSFVNPSKIQKQFEQYPVQMADIMNEVVDHLQDCPAMTIEGALSDCLNKRNISLSETELASVLPEFREVDRYIRNYFRQQIIKILVDNEIYVDVFGDGWSEFETDKKQYLRVHSAVSYGESLEIVGNSKISLNIMPWFKDGSHDRIFSSMLCGAVCLTDGSMYLEEQLRENENVVFYSLRGLKYLPRKVHQILDDTEKSAEIAENGRRLALQNHTWAARADEIIDYLEQLVGEKNIDCANEYKQDLILPQSLLIRNIKKVITHLHRQEYLYAMRKMNGILKQMMDMLPLYEKWFDLSEQDNGMTDMFSQLLDAQESGDHVLLADILEWRVLPFLIRIQEEYALQYEHEMEVIEGYRIEPTSSGEYTLAVDQERGWMYYHSNGNPFAEAVELANAWFDGEHYEYIVYGLGLGYHVQALLDIDEAVTVTVLEADKNIITLADRYGVLHDIEDSDRVKLIYDPEFKFLTEISDSLKKTQRFVIHYPSMQGIGNGFFREQLEEYFISDSSARTQETRLVGNFIKNKPGFGHEVTELQTKFYGKTAYIIAAGPSLDKNIMDLKKVSKEDIIISTGTVFKKLLETGIVPDYVIVTDGGAFTYAQTAGLTEQTTVLLYLPSVYYRIPGEYPGEKYVIFQKDFPKSEEYAKKRGYPLYETGGSVTTTALDLCVRMQCSRVVFVGLDLAYTDMRNHATHTADVKENVQGNIMVQDIYGNMVHSAKNLNLYRCWIEKRIQEEDAREIEFIDATQGGARIAGTSIKDLRDVVG